MTASLKSLTIAVVGATGAVGETMLSILAERGFPAGEVYAVASARFAGSRVAFGGRSLVVQDLARFDFEGVDIGLFSPGASVSKIHAPRAAAAGCVVIDNTSEFRYDDDIPLVVPEVNLDALGGYLSRNIVANPNCSTIQMVVALKPIYDAVGIERINAYAEEAGREIAEDHFIFIPSPNHNVINNRQNVMFPKSILRSFVETFRAINY